VKGKIAMGLLHQLVIGGIGMALGIIGPGVGPSHAANCQQLVDAFNAAVESGREDDAQKLVDQIATDAECGRFQVAAQRRLSAFRLSAVNFLMARGRPVADYERLLVAADNPEVLWQAAATLGEARFGERRFAESALAFDRAIEIIKNESLTPTAPSKFEIEGLVERAAQSRLLAANAEPESRGRGFVQTARNQRDGKLGGLYSPSVRGIVPRAIPIPITFETGKTTFTGIGEQAARELATVIKEQSPSRVSLVGHTDVRGAADMNMKLSQDRADAVAAYLRDNGVAVTIEAIGKGANEPARLSDTSGLSQDDIYALNRRVEWRRE
jgi:outer membrane protein OmpA-like peptidoglycan-associated protein